MILPKDRKCKVCGKHKGFGYDHKKCSKILQSLAIVAKRRKAQKPKESGLMWVVKNAEDRYNFF